MYAFMAFLPILVTIILMAAFNWPAKRLFPFLVIISSHRIALWQWIFNIIGLFHLVSVKL